MPKGKARPLSSSRMFKIHAHNNRPPASPPAWGRMSGNTSNAVEQNKNHMKPSLLPTPFLISAIGTIIGSLTEVETNRINLRALEARLSHEREMYGMKAEFLRDLLHSLVDRRVDAVERGFHDTLAMYAEQCRH